MNRPGAGQSGSLLPKEGKWRETREGAPRSIFVSGALKPAAALGQGAGKVTKMLRNRIDSAKKQSTNICKLYVNKLATASKTPKDAQAITPELKPTISPTEFV